MKAEAIIEAVVNAGGELTVSGDRIRYRLPKDCPEKERILDGLREHKPEIIRALASRPATCSPSCYEIEPGRWIHHPWNGCRTPLPESAEPTVPTHADCGCSGPVCRRCWLCVEHCRCLPKGICWHCGGEGRCACTACWKRSADETAQCVVCEGTGKLPGRVQ